MNPTLYLNIGSNKGDRRAFIARAVAAVSASPLFSDAEITTSAETESDPWGFSSSERFLNIGAAITFRNDFEWSEARLTAILEALQRVEQSISSVEHRNADGSYRDREIDIDIIAADNFVCSSARLTLPHPRMHLRGFVLKPMAELAPGWQHPLSGLSPSQLLKKLKR